MTKRAVRRGILAAHLGGLMCMVCASTQVYAQGEPTLEIDARLARRYGLPSDFDPPSAAIVSSSSDVVWVGNVGIESASACVVLAVGQNGATALTYRHQDRATACLSAALGDTGEIFLRGFDPTIMNNAVPSGFTAMLDASGTLKWAIDDTVLVNAEPRADGGTGDFIGAYGGVSGLLAYNPEQRALLAFSVGSLRLGLRATPVTQAHLIEVDTGRLSRTGQGFGANGAGLVSAALVEPGGQDYVLYTRNVAGVGGEFFRYDGRSSIDAIQPFDATWASRTVLAIERHTQRAQIALLWLDGPASNERVRLSMMTGAGDPLFEVELSSQLTDDLGNSVELGRPVRLYVGARYTVAQYIVGELRYMRVLDTGSGELLGGFYLEDLMSLTSTLGVVRVGEAGELRLVRWDRAQESLEEFVWTIVEEPEPGEDMGAGVGDMGVGDDMSPEEDVPPEVVGITGSEFCAMVPGKPGEPVGVLLTLLGLLGVRWRQRRSA